MTTRDIKMHGAIELLNDLLKINNDRIASYQKALDQSTNIEIGLREEFARIISEGLSYREQLAIKIWELNGDIKTETLMAGKIYQAWMDLKVSLPTNTQKSILASCQYNEEIALNTYCAALNQGIDLRPEARKLVEDQEQGLKKINTKMQKYRVNQHMAERYPVYFN